MLHFLGDLAQQSSDREAVWVYLLVTSMLPSYRWLDYSRCMRTAKGISYSTTLLEAYLEATCQAFGTFCDLLLAPFASTTPHFTPRLALTVAVTGVLEQRDIGQTGFHGLRLGARISVDFAKSPMLTVGT